MRRGRSSPGPSPLRRSRYGGRVDPVALVVRQTWRLAQWPAAAVVLFLVLSRLTVGAWFVSGGFYERDPTYDAQAVKITARHLVGHPSSQRLRDRDRRLDGQRRGSCGEPCGTRTNHRISSPSLSSLRPRSRRMRSTRRIRFGSATWCRWSRRARCFVGSRLERCQAGPKRTGPTQSAARRGFWLLLIASTLIESPPWSRSSPLLVEAQLDAANSAARQQVTDVPRARLSR